MGKSWKKLEDHVRAIAELRWSAPCAPEHLDGADFDGVVHVSRDEIVILECTEERNLDKVRADINKILPVRQRLAFTGIICRCFVVLADEPTLSMRETGEKNYITVCSVTDFEKHLFDFSAYSNLREMRPFGSAVDPDTGETDDRKFIPVGYFDNISGRSFGVREITSELIKRNGIVLVGDYGTGKSRCIREIFLTLKNKSSEAGAFPIAINLREHWGSRNGIEILAGHLESIGFSASIDNVIRLLNSGNLVLLLDGFDEVGAQTLDFRRENRKSVRLNALEGVRDLITRSKGGVIITGRAHYFDSDDEMLACLGFNNQKNRPHVIYSPDDFTAGEAEQYLQTMGISVKVPFWLPRKPLILHVLASIDSKEITSLLSRGYGEHSFWAALIQAVCKREAGIHTSLSPSAVEAVLLELAQRTRTHKEFLGRLTPAVLSDAYESALQVAPDESGRQMLARLCMLGRLEPDSPDRQFIDESILDILRAERLIHDVVGMRFQSDSVVWKNCLGVKGVVYAAEAIFLYGLEALCFSFFSKFGDHTKSRQISEMVSILSFTEGEALDFKGLQILESHVPMLYTGEREIGNLEIKNSYMGVLMLEGSKISDRSKVVIESGIIEKVTGLTNSSALPKWIVGTDVIDFDKISNVSGIRRSELSVAHKVFLAILHKIFFQPGKGREAASLLKGGHVPQSHPSIVDEILRLLLQERLIDRFKGDDGWVYTPVRHFTERMSEIMAELSLSDDPLWKKVGDLNKRS